MQGNTEQPPSLSQLLRESYLAEARAQQRHSRSDASSHLHFYRPLKSKAEDSVGSAVDPQFPDLSAFLSQEELDKSVNLARQAIGHESREERSEVKASVPPPSPPEPMSPPSANSSPAAAPVSQPSSKLKELPAKSDRKATKSVVTADGKEPGEAFNDFNRSGRNATYGPETQSKKEFLNKAADFIEELSSLFKANSSKRVRPRSCRSHRSRSQSKTQGDDALDPLDRDATRERVTAAAPPAEESREEVAAVQPDSSGGIRSEFQDLGLSEEPPPEQQQQQQQQQQCSASVCQDAKEDAGIHSSEGSAHPSSPGCERPHFIQKLKSREVPEGSKVRLDCIVRGIPAPEVRWFCEGKELENSPDIQIITSAELHSLIIAEAFEEDTGRYSCFASNFYGTDSTSAEIYVEGTSSSDSEGEQHFEHVAESQRKSLTPLSSPTVSPEEEEFPPSSPTPAETPAHQLCGLPSTCQITPEVPLPGSPLPPQETFEAAVTSAAHPAEEEAAAPPLVQVLPHGDAVHPERQEVPATLASAPATVATPFPLTPVPQPEGQDFKHDDDLQELLNGQHIMAAPVFTKCLQDVLASESQLVVLECRVKGVPSPQVDWSRDGALLEDSPEFRILQKKPRSPAESEEICTLVIAEVFPEDSGTFTCTASNIYGATSSTATLKVKGNGRSNHARPLAAPQEGPGQTREPSSAAPFVNLQAEAAVTNSVKPHSSTIRLEPLGSGALRLEPLNTSTLRLDPLSSSMLRPDALSASLHSLEPSSLASSSSSSSSSSHFVNSLSASSPNLGPLKFETGPVVFSSLPARDASAGPMWRPPDASPKLKEEAANHQNGSPAVVVVPLPDPPPNSCLKTGTLANHRDSRSSSRAGLRVHFRLPEDEEEEEEQSGALTCSEEDRYEASVTKEPPPVRAKPKLDPAQLQLLHNQVLMEQLQQEGEPPAPAPAPAPAPSPPVQPQSLPPTLVQVQVQPDHQRPPWSPQTQHFPPFPTHLNAPHSPPQPPPPPPPTGYAATPFPPRLHAPPAPHLTSSPQLKSPPPVVTSPPPAPRLQTVPFPASVAPATQTNAFHASHLNLSPAALFRAPPTTASFLLDPTPAPPQQVAFPTAHSSLVNLAATSHAFTYARPKAFIAAQTLSPVRSPSPTESPVPLLQELAAELNSSAASSPTLPAFPPPPRVLPTRVLMSPTSPPSLVSSPTFPGGGFALRAQSPPQASSPTSSSSTPSPIQNPVAFLSSVLPSLTPSQPTNSMGLPKGAPVRLKKNVPKVNQQSAENIRHSREIILQDIEKKLQLRDDIFQYSHQQKLSVEGKTASRPLGPIIPATVFNYDEEYKVSNFEQRLMNEIEFRLERTPVEESDDEVQHDDVPTGRCIAPIFDKKLKNFKATEGVPVTFSCKIVGIPVPKVYWFKDGTQILRKNVHYRKFREGDGTCALHIERTTADDDGNYTVMASNPQGRTSCSGHLIVQTGPPRGRQTPIHSQRVRTRNQEAEDEQTQERFFRPHFLQAPGDMLAHEGKLCRLDCKVNGLPNPELMWLVNGRPIYPDLYHRMLVRENAVHSLVIDPVTQKDAGAYTCIASNKAGQSSFTLELKVVA
ncbi:myopalladin isoform X3 [Nelusetta ayraudi]|uniref:myopalladin isoform X3 n=1 Tax=Nelusetta ayraudi TaxID=303726 RepID=UPI003F6E653D